MIIIVIRIFRKAVGWCLLGGMCVNEKERWDMGPAQLSSAHKYPCKINVHRSVFFSSHRQRSKILLLFEVPLPSAFVSRRGMEDLAGQLKESLELYLFEY